MKISSPTTLFIIALLLLLSGLYTYVRHARKTADKVSQQDAVVDAIVEAGKNGGGTVYIPSGIYDSEVIFRALDRASK